MFGANPAAGQRILRHSDIRVTMDVYGHLAPGYLRTEIDRLSFLPKSDGITSPLFKARAKVDLPAPNRLDATQHFQPLNSVGARGSEPPTFCSQSRRATRLRHAPSEGQYTPVGG